MSGLTKNITSMGLSLALLAVPATAVLTISAQPAIAQKGGNGNGNAGRGERGNAGQATRGNGNRGNSGQATRGNGNRGNSDQANHNNGNRGNSAQATQGNGRANTGNANGNGNSAGNNGRGSVASDLRGANAANSSSVAQARAAITSRPGQTAAYQQAVAHARSLSYAAAETGNVLAALQGMTKEAFEAANPGLNYEETLAAYDSAYRTQLESAAIAQQQADRSLATITGGRQITPEALSQLNAMLGL